MAQTYGIQTSETKNVKFQEFSSVAALPAAGTYGDGFALVNDVMYKSDGTSWIKVAGAGIFDSAANIPNQHGIYQVGGQVYTVDSTGAKSPIIDNTPWQQFTTNAVANILGAANATGPTKIATWDNIQAGVSLTANGVLFSSAGGIYQIRQSNISLTAGHEYLAVFKLWSKTAKFVSIDGLYPDVAIQLRDGGDWLTGLDFQSSSALGFGELHPIKSDRNQLISARFISPTTSSGGGNFYIRDTGNANMPWECEIEFSGLYDITGLSNGTIIKDSTNDFYYPLREVNLIGDSLTYQIKSRIKSRLGFAKLNHNGQETVLGSQLNGSNVITFSDTSFMQNGWDITGNSLALATGNAPAYIGSKTDTTVNVTQSDLTTPVNATRDLATNYYRVGYHGPGKSATQVASAWAAHVARVSASANNPSIIWVGHNEIATPSTVKAKIAEIVATLKGDYRVLTLVKNTGYTDTEKANTEQVNKWILSNYGYRAVDAASILMQAGLTTNTDVNNVRKGLTPASMLADAIHINSLGSDIVCDAIQKSIPKDWGIY